MIDVAADALADDVMEPKDGFRRFIRREPLGVVLVMAPWNYPYLASVNTVVPAIVAGNSVILKVSQQTPRVAERYAEAFRDAGLPDGVFQYLHASHDDVAGMIADRRIRFVAFTGSVAGGQAVQRAASEQFIATNLELGGKDPAYVRADAPLEAHDREPRRRRVLQCRPIVLRGRADLRAPGRLRPFVDGFVDLTRKYRLGNPLDPETTLGPMVRATRGGVRPRSDRRGRPQGRARADRSSASSRPRREGTPYLAPQVLRRRRSPHARDDRGDVRSGRRA